MATWNSASKAGVTSCDATAIPSEVCQVLEVLSLVCRKKDPYYVEVPASDIIEQEVFWQSILPFF